MLGAQDIGSLILIIIQNFAGLLHFRCNPGIDNPYQGKKKAELVFTAIAPGMRMGGTAIKTIYALAPTNPTKPPRRYLGKVGSARGFQDDPDSIRRLTKKRMNFDAMLEKIAYDLYQEFGRGIFHVPKSYLSRQPIRDSYNQTDLFALHLVATPTTLCNRDSTQTKPLPQRHA